MLIEETAPCTTLNTVPTPTGGDIIDGTYKLLSWESLSCLAGLAQTFTISATAPNTYSLETVATFQGVRRANGVSVTDGTSLTNTTTCGNEEGEPIQLWSYSAFEQDASQILMLSSETAVFTYVRIGD